MTFALRVLEVRARKDAALGSRGRAAPASVFQERERVGGGRGAMG